MSTSPFTGKEIKKLTVTWIQDGVQYKAHRRTPRDYTFAVVGTEIQDDGTIRCTAFSWHQRKDLAEKALIDWEKQKQWYIEENAKGQWLSLKCRATWKMMIAEVEK